MDFVHPQYQDPRRQIASSRLPPGVSMTLEIRGRHNGVIDPFLKGHGDSRHSKLQRRTGRFDP